MSYIFFIFLVFIEKYTNISKKSSNYLKKNNFFNNPSNNIVLRSLFWSLHNKFQRVFSKYNLNRRFASDLLQFVCSFKNNFVIKRFRERKILTGNSGSGFRQMYIFRRSLNGQKVKVNRERFYWKNGGKTVKKTPKI